MGKLKIQVLRPLKIPWKIHVWEPYKLKFGDFKNQVWTSKKLIIHVKELEKFRCTTFFGTTCLGTLKNQANSTLVGLFFFNKPHFKAFMKPLNTTFGGLWIWLYYTYQQNYWKKMENPWFRNYNILRNKFSRCQKIKKKKCFKC